MRRWGERVSWFGLKTTVIVCQWFGIKTTGMVCQWFCLKTTQMVSPGLASKLVVQFLWVWPQNWWRWFSWLSVKTKGDGILDGKVIERSDSVVWSTPCMRRWGERVSWLSLKIKVHDLSVVWPQNHCDSLSVVLAQNHSDGFSRFGLKTGGTVSPGLASKLMAMVFLA
jgi:hypothetical protein